MSAGSISIRFSDHVEERYRSIIVSFMNTLSRSYHASGSSGYVFDFENPARLEKARTQLVEWERDGVVRWADI